MVRQLRLIVLNDVYALDRETGVGRGGLAAAKTTINRLRDEAPGDCLVVLAGDFFGGSSLAVQTQGEVVVDVLNEIDVDAVVLGNHEFDFGWQRLEYLIGKSKAKVWLGENVRHDDGTLLEGVQGCKTFETSCGLKVGILGVCTRAVPTLSSPGEGVRFEDPIPAAKKTCERLREQGADIVIGLTHLGIANDKELISAVPDIDFVIGGHDHDPIGIMYHDRFLFKCGQNAYWVGTVDVTMDERNTPDLSWAMVSTNGVKEDARILDIIHAHQKQAQSGEDQEWLDEVITKLLAPLDGRSNEIRRNEGSFGTLVADSIFEYFEKEGGRPDIAIINGGFIRGDKLYPAGTKLTRRHIFNEMPFPRVGVCAELAGEHLLMALEQTLRFLPAASGSFPHFSDGVIVRVDASRPALHRIVSMTLHGQDIVPTQTYRVCMTEFNLAGGDGVSGYSYGVQLNDVESIRIPEMTVRYLESRSTVTPISPGRLQFV
mmetsp:Transcript_7076/g.13083  ORF Transcript_7076/g.13083 Transcript_7076/m.13083 type:complete len:487 (+) Transcript_7076:190-1650(+)